MSKLLPTITGPADLKKLSNKELTALAGEIRAFLLANVSKTGGHLAPNLGVVELTLAIHTTFDSPTDEIIWDVGHQSYVHKILTGRADRFASLRQYGGMSGFPKIKESEHDIFQTGHSSTSISAALGVAQARDLLGKDNHVLAVIGDGAMGGGMAFEALNHAGDMGTNLIVVLNDNEMSISHNVGGLAAYLGRIRTDPKYFRFKEDFQELLLKIPAIGGKMIKSVDRIKDAVKSLIVPGMLFEELGFTYLGPVNGHNLEAMQGVMRGAKKLKGPILIHVLTKKGKGYDFTENNPDFYHGVGPFDPQSPPQPGTRGSVPSYTDVFGDTMVQLGREQQKLIAITAAMTSGTGLSGFAQTFPQRFFDVGIAEQHAVTFAAGLARKGFKPVVAIYSTFLQRAYDQVLHDVCMQELPVVFAVDRAGLVGEDGETHHGVFDISLLRPLPNLSIICPRDENYLQHALFTGLKHNSPVAIRYPRGKGQGAALETPRCLPWGRGEMLRQGRDVTILAVGTMVAPALAAAAQLEKNGLSVAVIDLIFVKPLDTELVVRAALNSRYGLVTVEENVLAGGLGSAVLEYLEDNGLQTLPVKRLGIPDQFVQHGARNLLLKDVGLTVENIAAACLGLASSKGKISWVKSVND
ncbi:MAG TPA: 1-deoxy-D-xylulose-5-phosphate synthase [Oscillospiraceae bacterium]|nr:1-deoxy-D-xylulose-5-phosphate synthase [Oscillospiraceae bacterium]